MTGQLKVIASRLEKKIHSELKSMLENEREKYEAFFKNFGLQLKYGVYNEYGQHKEMLQDLLLVYLLHEDKPVTLAEYAGRMKEDQKAVYYACGENVDKIKKLPQAEMVLDKGYELLYLTDDIDEFALKMLREWDGKPFQSVSAGDLDLETPEEKEEAKKRPKSTNPCSMP